MWNVEPKCPPDILAQATPVCFQSGFNLIIYISICNVYIPSYHHKMLSLYPHSFPPQAPVQMGTPTTNPGGPHPGSGRQRNSIRIGMVFCAFLFSHYNLRIPWLDIHVYIHIYIYTLNYMLYIYMYICTYIVLHIYTHSYPCAYKLCKPEIGLSFRLHVCK